jgi:hypothetical protein
MTFFNRWWQPRIGDFNQMVSQLAITTVKKEMLEASEERLKRSNEQLQAEMIERQRAEAERQEMESQLQRAQICKPWGTWPVVWPMI